MIRQSAKFETIHGPVEIFYNGQSGTIQGDIEIHFRKPPAGSRFKKGEVMSVPADILQSFYWELTMWGMAG